MADLDDFFAKKDRKKSKTVKKFSTADEVTKKLDDPKQKVESRPKRDRTQEGEDGVRRGEEDEWREYEETIKDYTGLKIQHLTGSAAAGGQGSGGGSGGETGGDDDAEENPDGTVRQNSKQKGPWNKSQSDGAPPPVKKEQPVEPKEPPPVKEPPKMNQYIPPHMKNKQPELERRPMNRRQARHAPDIHNDDYFPVLGASGKGRGTATGGGPGTGGGGWSTAGGAGSASNQPTVATPQRVSTGNRFTQLTNDS